MAKQDRAVRTRQELIRSAAQVFDRAGFADSSIAQVCAGAGVSQGALHFHFRNKRALGEAVESAAAQTLAHVIGSVPVRHCAPLQLLVDTSHSLAHRLAHDTVLRAGFALGSDATWHGGVNLWQEWRDWVQRTLTVSREQGSVAADVVLDDAVCSITAVIAGLEVLARSDAHWHACEAVTRFWRLMLPQLSSEAARDRLDAAGSGALAFGSPDRPEDRPADGDRDGEWATWLPCDALSGG